MKDKIIDKLVDALKAAHDHLEWTGYGDSWESSCAEGLDEKINEALEAAKATNENDTS